MVFSSLPFLFLFLTVVLLVSHLLPFKFRNFFLLLANLVFYAYGEPVYVLIMIASILVNFFAGVLMDKQPTQSRTWLPWGCLSTRASSWTRCGGFPPSPPCRR